MAKTLAAKDRRVSSAVMSDVMEFAPQDGFKLDDSMLGKEYTTIAVKETEFAGKKSFTVTLESEDGKVINLPASAWKRARVLSKSDVKAGKPFPGTKNCFTRSQASDIWDSSVYFHATGDTMKKDDDFVVPAKVKIVNAVLSEISDEAGNQIPALNPFLYKGYRKVVAEYQNRNEFPTMDDFRAELLKTENRIAGLPAGLNKLEPQTWVKEEEVGNYKHNLILSDEIVR